MYVKIKFQKRAMKTKIAYRSMGERWSFQRQVFSFTHIGSENINMKIVIDCYNIATVNSERLLIQLCVNTGVCPPLQKPTPLLDCGALMDITTGLHLYDLKLMIILSVFRVTRQDIASIKICHFST